MFYRRKVLLAMLQEFNGQLEPIALHKLLFLFSLQQETPVYDFVPYHYGSYSFSAHADLVVMAQKGLLEKNDRGYHKSDKIDYFSNLKLADRLALSRIKRDFQNYDSDELMRFTYLNFAYYAINSKTAPRLLTALQLEKVAQAKPRNNNSILYTIGYESISLEEYLNRLLKHDVRVLVDVRSNPVSMKFGFSRKPLKSYCESLHIEYVHLPELGIRTEYRQGLTSQSSYDTLFAEYQKTTLAHTADAQKKIVALLKTKQRIALTCFEADICKCHRTHLANAISRLTAGKFALRHL